MKGLQTHLPATGASRVVRCCRGQRGAAIVEMAIVFPLLALMLFGITSFGSIYNNYETLRQGTRDAARQTAVGLYGSNTSCNLTGLTVATNETREVICEAKDLVGLGYSTRVKVLMVDTVTAPPYGAAVV